MTTELLDTAVIIHEKDESNDGLGAFEYLGKQGIDKGTDFIAGEIELIFPSMLSKNIRDDICYYRDEIISYLKAHLTLDNVIDIEFGEPGLLTPKKIYIVYTGVLA